MEDDEKEVEILPSVDPDEVDAAAVVEDDIGEGSNAGNTEPDVTETETTSDDDEPETIEQVDPMSLPLGEVFASPELTARALVILESKINDAMRRRSELDEEIRQLNAKNEIVKRAQARQGTAKQEAPHVAIQRRARESQMERAERVKNLGMTQQELRDALAPGSKLDTALMFRKR